MRPREPMEIAAAGLTQLAALRMVLELKADVLAGLAVGQAVEGKVVETMRDGAVLLSLRGSLVPARVQRPVAGGTTLMLRVEQIEPQIVLRATEDGAGSLGPPGRLLSASAELPAALTDVLSDLAAGDDDVPADLAGALREAQDDLARLLPDASKLSAESVRRGIEGSGVGYEGRLAELAARGVDGPTLAAAARHDLKGVLLRLGTRLGGGRRRAARLAARIETAVSALEARQALNATSIRQGEIQVTLPLLQGDTPSFVHLGIQRDPADGEPEGTPRERGYRVLMLLEFDGLGPTRVDVRMQRGQVGGRILVRDIEASAYLGERVPELSERLAAVAGIEGHVGCGAAAEPESDALFIPPRPLGLDGLAPLDVKV